MGLTIALMAALYEVDSILYPIIKIQKSLKILVNRRRKHWRKEVLTPVRGEQEIPKWLMKNKPPNEFFIESLKRKASLLAHYASN